MIPTLLALAVAALLGDGPAPPSSVCRPVYCLDDAIRAPLEPYVPQPGDIFLATDASFFIRVGHAMVGGAGVHHSGLIFARPDGRLGLIEAGPFNELVTRVMDPHEHMSNHVAAGTIVWVRRRRIPLTPEQSARLTTFTSAHEGKPFALARGLSFATPFSRRGVLRTRFVGRVHGDRPRYFCSELVVECLVAAGLMDRATARPSATLPRDLFFGRSGNPYLDRHLNMEPGWYPPARWLPGPPGWQAPRRTSAQNDRPTADLSALPSIGSNASGVRGRTTRGPACLDPKASARGPRGGSILGIRTHGRRGPGRAGDGSASGCPRCP